MIKTLSKKTEELSEDEIAANAFMSGAINTVSKEEAKKKNSALQFTSSITQETLDVLDDSIFKAKNRKANRSSMVRMVILELKNLPEEEIQRRFTEYLKTYG